MAEARTDDVRHAQAAAFIEGSSGFFFKVNFLKKEIQSIYSLKGQRGDQRSKTLSQKGGGYVENKHKEVREGRHAFSKCMEICFEILTLVNP